MKKNKLIKYEINPYAMIEVRDESRLTHDEWEKIQIKKLEESLNDFVANIKGTITYMHIYKAMFEVPYGVYFAVQEDK